jgi:hypothetical protein
MVFQPVPATVQIQLMGREDGQTTINDLSFYHTGGEPTTGELITLLEDVCAWYAGSIGSVASSTWTFVLGKLRVLSTQTGITLANAAHTTPGGVGGPPAPNNVSFAVSFRTAIGGRGGRGRNYMPGIPDQALTGNTVNSDFVTNYVNFYSALLVGGGVIDAPWAWVVVHRYQDKVRLPVGEVNSVEAVVASDNVVDSMRRRLPGRGR